MMCHKVLDKKEKSSNSVILVPTFYWIILKKTSEHHFIPEYTYLPIYLPIKTF